MSLSATGEHDWRSTAVWPDAAAVEVTLDDVRRRLDEVHAQLCFAERTLAHDQRPEAPARRMREQWAAAVRRLDDLRDTQGQPELPMLEALGRERGLVRVGRRTLQLRRRHTEILVLLACHPLGMTTEELAVALYGEAGRPGSARTELCRLRKDLAPWIHNERNRITVQIDADFLVVQRVLRAGRAWEAAQRYCGELLPRSEAPGVVEMRNELDGWVRSAVMTSDDREALWAWLETGSGVDDVLAWKRFLADVDFDDPRRSLAVSRIARLRGALNLVR